jgi:hypothetical protein
MMLEMLRVAQGNADMIQSWFKLMTPPSGPNTSTSLDQREMPNDDNEWQPMKADDMVKLMGEEERLYFEQMVK